MVENQARKVGWGHDFGHELCQYGSHLACASFKLYEAKDLIFPSLDFFIPMWILWFASKMSPKVPGPKASLLRDRTLGLVTGSEGSDLINRLMH